MTEDTKDTEDKKPEETSEDTEDKEDVDSGLTNLMKGAKQDVTIKLEQGEHPFDDSKPEAAEELKAKEWKKFFEPYFSERFKGEELEEEARRIRTHLRSLWDLAEVETKQDLKNYCKTFESVDEEEQVEWKIAENLSELSEKERTELLRLISQRTEEINDYVGKMKQKDIKNDIRQKSANLESEDEGEGLESVTTEDKITENLEIAGTEIELNPSTRFKVEELKEEVNEVVRNPEGVVKKKDLLNLYEIKLGEGSDQEELQLVSEPSRKLPKGKCWKPIKFLSIENNEETFQKLYRGKDIGSTAEEFFHAAEGDYLMLAERISEKSKRKVKNLGNDQLREIVFEYLDDGHDYDPKIKKVMYPLLIRHSRENVDPDQVIPKAPHLLMLTNSSVGKTFISRKVGVRRDSASLPGLIGYASAENVEQGELDQAIEAQLIDEFTRDKKSKDTGSGLLSIMEVGVYNNTQAGVNLQTELYAPISFMTNPEKDREELSREDEDDFSIYLEAFNEAIRELGGNFSALGSRFGTVLFDENLQTAEGSSLPRERRMKLQSLVNWIIDEIAPSYSDIEEECDWLDQPFSSDYRREIRELSKSISFEPEFHAFWKSHLEAYRHTKGLALRAAALEHLSDLLNDDYSIEEITDTARKHLEQFKQINRESLLEMINTTSQEAAMQRKRRLMKTEADYVQYFLQSIISFYSSREDFDASDRQPLGLLKDEWQGIKEGIGSVKKGDRYWRFSKLRESFEDNWSSNKSLIKKKYGIRLSQYNDRYFFSVDNMEKFSLLLEGEEPLESKDKESSLSFESSEQKVFESHPNAEMLERILERIPEEGIYEGQIMERFDYSETEVSKALNWLESEDLIAEENGKLKSQSLKLRQVLGGS